MRYILAFVIGTLVGGYVVDRLNEQKQEEQWRVPDSSHTRSHRLRGLESGCSLRSHRGFSPLRLSSLGAQLMKLERRPT